MRDDEKAKEQLITELHDLRKRLAALEEERAGHKQVEEPLKESAHPFKLLYEEATIPYQSLDERGNFIDVNEAWLQTLGYTKEDVIGKNFCDFIHTEWRDHFEENFPRFKATGKVLGVEFEMLKKDGSTIPVSFNGVTGRDHNGGFRQTHCIFQDITERKNAEQALQESERKYRELVELANCTILRWTHDGRITFLNEFGQQFFGYSAEEIIGRHVVGTIVPKIERSGRDLERLMEQICADPKAFEQNVNENMRRNGERVWIAWTNKIVWDTHGQVSEILSVGTDITERKQAEDALRESRERFRTLSAATFEGVTLSERGIVIDVNSQLAQMLGSESHEIIGRPIMEFIVPEDRELVQRNIDIGNELPYENRLLSKDGSTLMVETRARHFVYQGRNVRVTVLRDITDLKQAEKALRESRERFQELAELLPETIFEMDTSGHLTFVNRNAYDHFGYSQEDFELGLNGFDLLSSEDRPKAMGHAKKVMSGGEAGLNEYKAVRKDGSTFPALIRSSAKFHDGKPVGIRGIVIDVTERKKLESQLRQAQKLEAIGTLAGGIAHDFNNILGAIIGFTELALTAVPKEGALGHNLNEVLKAGFRASDLVKQILSFSRQTEQVRKPIQIASVVKEALKLLRSSLPTTIEIRQDIARSVYGCIVLADPTQIHQVLMNLCTNAAHSMRTSGGVLSVRLDVDAINVSQHPDLSARPYLRLTVTDTGHGMDAAVLERIFDPYFTTKAPGEGTGLGLSVVQGIVKNYGGVITVHSEPDRGTTFHVFLPTVQGHAAAEAKTREVIPTGTERILFVDDEIALANFGNEALVSLGYNVSAKTSSLEALEIFRADPGAFDLVITDMTMPELTGTALAKEILALRRDMPVILCTGFSELINRKQAYDLGICEFVMKPYTIATLANAVRKALDQKL